MKGGLVLGFVVCFFFLNPINFFVCMVILFHELSESKPLRQWTFYLFVCHSLCHLWPGHFHTVTSSPFKCRLGQLPGALAFPALGICLWAVSNAYFSRKCSSITRLGLGVVEKLKRFLIKAILDYKLRNFSLGSQ